MVEKKVPPARIERTTPGLGIPAAGSSEENSAARCGGMARRSECTSGASRSVPHVSAARLWAECGLLTGAPPSCAPAAASAGAPLLAGAAAIPCLAVAGATLPGCAGPDAVQYVGVIAAVFAPLWVVVAARLRRRWAAEDAARAEAHRQFIAADQKLAESIRRFRAKHAPKVIAIRRDAGRVEYVREYPPPGGWQ